MPETTEQKIEYFDAKYLDPKYPIVKADPSVDDVIKSLRFSDYFFTGGTVAGTWVYGYLLGKPVRGPTAAMCASAGFTFAMFYTMQNLDPVSTHILAGSLRPYTSTTNNGERGIASA